MAKLSLTGEDNEKSLIEYTKCKIDTIKSEIIINKNINSIEEFEASLKEIQRLDLNEDFTTIQCLALLEKQLNNKTKFDVVSMIGIMERITGLSAQTIISYVNEICLINIRCEIGEEELDAGINYINKNFINTKKHTKREDEYDDR